MDELKSSSKYKLHMSRPTEVSSKEQILLCCFAVSEGQNKWEEIENHFKMASNARRSYYKIRQFF